MAPTALDAAMAELDALIAQVEGKPGLGSGPAQLRVPAAAAPAPAAAAAPAKATSPAAVAAVVSPPAAPTVASPTAPSMPAKPARKKGKGNTESAAAAGSADGDAASNFEKSLLQVAVVREVVEHPNSDKLYICQVEYMPGQSCQVITGLQKFYKADELAQRKVAIVRNLKAAKLAGSLSEAMILAGATHLPDGNEIVKVLDPPVEANIGDRIYLQGGVASKSPAKQLSSKVWDKIVGLLTVKGGFATYDGKNLVTSVGPIGVTELPDGAGIH